MTQQFADSLTDDLRRPHPFAHERVGFIFGPAARAGKNWLVFPSSYEPVPDAQYIDDRRVGAKIGSDGIRAALQRTLSSGESCFHVHLHSPIAPGFGALDIREQDQLLPSFAATSPRVPHGALVLFGCGAEARAWLPGAKGPVGARRIATVGFPLRLYGGDS